MSKIALPIAELKTALAGLGKVVSKRTTLPVLSHVKIERAQDGQIAITGTDLDAFVTVRLEKPSEGKPLSLLVPFEDLLKLSKSCPKADTLLLTGDDDRVTIQYAVGNQVAETRVGSLPVEEFPEIPRVKGEPVSINESVRQSIYDAMKCASIDGTRLILNAAYIDVSKPDGHYVVGTDGRHLFSSNSFKLSLKESFILPTHKFLGYREFNQDGEWQITVGKPHHKDEQPWFQIGSRRWRFIYRQLEGTYPNWRQVVPNDSAFNTRIFLDSEQLDSLAHSIERLPDHDLKDHTIGIERVDRVLNLLWKSEKAQEWKRLPVTVKRFAGKDVTIYLNRHLLAKALRFGLCKIEIIDSLSPLKFSDGGRQMIVMPLRPEAASSAASPPRKVVPSAAAPHQPPPQAEQPEKTSMPRNTNGNGHQHATQTKPALESAMEQIETIKGSYREAIRGLNELGETLKQVHREHKTVQSVRTTLERLQTVRI